MTRISINPQTLNDHVLETIGRRHTAAQTLEAFSLARACGYDDINMDLIVGLPEDTMESFQETMQGVLALHPESITVHTLSLKRSARIFQDDSEPFSRDAALAGICWIGAMHSSSNMAMRRIICTGKAGWWATWKTRVGRSRGKRASTMSISWMKRIPYWHAVRVRSRRCGTRIPTSSNAFLISSTRMNTSAATGEMLTRKEQVRTIYEEYWRARQTLSSV